MDVALEILHKSVRVMDQIENLSIASGLKQMALPSLPLNRMAAQERCRWDIC